MAANQQPSFLVVVPEDVNTNPAVTCLPNFTPYVPSADAELVPCNCCGNKGWLGQKQQDAWAKYADLSIICMYCVKKFCGPGVTPAVRLVDEIV